MTKRLRIVCLALAACAAPGGNRDAPDSVAAIDHEHPLAWLTGRWLGEGFGGVVEESWLPSSGGAMLGTFRLVTDGRPTFYELMAIEDRAEGPVMLLKHFDPDLSSWEERDESLVWPGEESADGRVRFGPVEYGRRGTDELLVRVALSGDAGSEVQELFFRRVEER